MHAASRKTVKPPVASVIVNDSFAILLANKMTVYFRQSLTYRCIALRLALEADNPGV